MTDPVDFSKKKREKDKSKRIGKEDALESLDALREAIEELSDDEDVTMYICSFLVNDGSSIEACGINVGDELKALGLLNRWQHLINYLYDES